MRAIDRKKNFKKANIIAEQNYLKSKGLLTESFHDANGTPIGVDSMHRPVTSGVQKTDSDIDELAYEILNIAGHDYEKQNNLIIQTANGDEEIQRRLTNRIAFLTQNNEPEIGINEEEVVTDLEYITFSYNGKNYKISDVIGVDRPSNGLKVEFGIEEYKNGEVVPVGNILTYYMDYDNNIDKLLLTINYGETIDAKREIDPRFGLYEKIKTYINANI